MCRPDSSTIAQEAPKKTGKGAMPGAAGAQPQELSWLMRTSYISSSDARAKPQLQSPQAADADGEAETLESQLDAIEVRPDSLALRVLQENERS